MTSSYHDKHFLKKIVEKIQTHILCEIIPLPHNIVPSVT